MVVLDFSRMGGDTSTLYLGGLIAGSESGLSDPLGFKIVGSPTFQRPPRLAAPAGVGEIGDVKTVDDAVSRCSGVMGFKPVATVGASSTLLDAFGFFCFFAAGLGDALSVEATADALRFFCALLPDLDDWVANWS